MLDGREGRKSTERGEDILVRGNRGPCGTRRKRDEDEDENATRQRAGKEKERVKEREGEGARRTAA